MDVALLKAINAGLGGSENRGAALTRLRGLPPNDLISSLDADQKQKHLAIVMEFCVAGRLSEDDCSVEADYGH